MTNDELDRMYGLTIKPVAVIVTPKPPLGQHAVMIREDGSFLMPTGAKCEYLYVQSDYKALLDAKTTLVSAVRERDAEIASIKAKCDFWIARASTYELKTFAQEVEIKRLRALVRDAYDEGLSDGQVGHGDSWEITAAKRALDCGAV